MKENTIMTYNICMEDLISCHIAEASEMSGLDMFGEQEEKLWRKRSLGKP
jgi:hypothetical protein